MDTLLKRLNRIGSGAYAKIYNIVDPREDDPKSNVLKRNFSEPNIDFCFNLRELDILARLRGHPFIVKLNKVSFDQPFRPEQPLTPTKNGESKDDNVHFFLESMLMSTKGFFSESERSEGYYLQINILTCQLLLAVEYVHAKGITHRDIKPDNILLGENSHHGGECGIFLRLADFGMSKPLSRNFPSTPGCVTALYRAPEIVMGIDYDHKSDMWSVGCVLFEMIAGTPFIRTDTNKDTVIYRDIIANLPNEPNEGMLADMWNRSKVPRMNPISIRPLPRQTLEERSGISAQEQQWFDAISPNNTHNFFGLMNSLLTIDPLQRPSATDSLNSPLFDPMRAYINTVHQRHPVVADNFTITIVACNERSWVASIVAGIVNNAEEHKWYSHRIIFHSISLFDRYLAWADTHVTKNTKPSDSVGTFHSTKDVGLYYFVCLYVSYKYFLSITSINYSWKEFVSPIYTTESIIMQAKAIEENIIENVLEYKLYNLNIIEIPEQRGYALDTNLVSVLLQGYLKIHETFTGRCTVDEMFNAIMPS